MNLPTSKTVIILGLALAATQLAAQSVNTESELVTLEEFRVTAPLEEFSDIARLDKTPVSFTEVTKQAVTDALASRDIPFALQNAPSFYVTNTGGGAGDTRLSVRGFNQRNVSILINGVPTNDIENGWLYWSNWDGLGDVTSVIQLQRGMSAVTLPTQSIGGTLNIITDPAAARRGASAKFEVGENGFWKQTYVVNSGLLADRFALTLGYVQKEGSGFVRGTWTEGQGYYLGASWAINSKHKLELFGITAPQRHGQNTFQQNIATYDANFARSLGFTEAQIAFFPEQGRRYNQQLGPVSPNYGGRIRARFEARHGPRPSQKHHEQARRAPTKRASCLRPQEGLLLTKRPPQRNARGVNGPAGVRRRIGTRIACHTLIRNRGWAAAYRIAARRCACAGAAGSRALASH